DNAINTIIIKDDAGTQRDTEWKTTSTPINVNQDLPIKLPAGRVRFTITDGTGNYLQTLTVNTPTMAGPAAPAINAASNTKLIEPERITGSIDVYRNYLRIRGELPPANSGQLRFALFKNLPSGELVFTHDVPPRTLNSTDSGTW